MDNKPKRVPPILPVMVAIASSAVPEEFDGDLMDYLLSDAYPELFPKAKGETDQESDTD